MCFLHAMNNPPGFNNTQPHWFWGVCFVLLPFCLTALGFVGIYRGAFISFGVASLAPRLAVVLSLSGLTAAVLRRRRVPILITMLGVAISLSGLLLLMWLA